VPTFADRRVLRGQRDGDFVKEKINIKLEIKTTFGVITKYFYGGLQVIRQMFGFTFQMFP
jgi:hypothetical protein